MPVVDPDAGTVAALRGYRAGRRPRTRSRSRRSCSAPSMVVPARTAPGEERLPVIRLHDLRHTHATLLLADGVPVEVVSERLGHASATITLTVYQHVHPGMGREAADRFAALLEG